MNETTLRNAQELREIIVATRLQLYNQAVPCGPKAIRQALESTKQQTVK
jgi:hypothetical protein